MVIPSHICPNAGKYGDRHMLRMTGLSVLTCDGCGCRIRSVRDGDTVRDRFHAAQYVIDEDPW